MPRPTKTLSVGSRVKYDFGVIEVTATVIEDRGNIGMGGRRLLRVRFDDFPDTSEPYEIEAPESELTAITSKPRSARNPSRRRKKSAVPKAVSRSGKAVRRRIRP